MTKINPGIFARWARYCGEMMVEKALLFAMVLFVAGGMAVAKEYIDQEHVLADDILVVKQPPVIPVVDTHAHFGATEASYELAVKTMDEANIAVTIVLSGSNGERLDKHLALAAKYPGRFIVFCGPRASREKWYNDDIGEVYAKQIEDAHKKGAAGVGEVGKWALYDAKTTWDAPRLDAMWAKIEALQIPVNWHVADPSRYWRPENPYNTLESPSYYRKRPLKFALLMQQERVLEKHPKMIVIASHSNYLTDMIPMLEYRFRKYPNYHVDLSAAVGEWGRVSEEFKFLVTEYADRFLYGTDAGYRESSVEMFGGGEIDVAAHNMSAFHLAHYMFLGTDQRSLPIPFHGNYGKTLVGWKAGYSRYVHDGVKLPEDVLRKIYYRNAERLFGIEVEGWKAPKTPWWHARSKDR